MSHFLVLGGARSGKTGFAERLTIRLGQRPAYLATAETLDDEMRERVRTHRQKRPAHFATIEEPLRLANALREAAETHDAILVDCLTLWITNLIIANEPVAEAVDELIAALGEITRSRIIMVTNEVGLGIVPDNAMARLFRDLAGSTHQRIADICPDVYFVVAGLPMVLKGESPAL